MKMNRIVWAAMMATLLGATLTGCGDKKAAAPAPTPPPQTTAKVVPAEPEGPTDEELAKKIVGKWKATITLPTGAADQVKQLQMLQEQAIAKSGPVILELKDDKTYALTSFGVRYKGDYTVEAGFLEIKPRFINDTPVEEMIGKKITVSFTNQPVEITKDSTEAANLEILEDGLTLRMDQGQNMTMLIYRRV